MIYYVYVYMTSMLYNNVSGMYLYTEVNNCLGSNYITCPQYVSCCNTLVSTGILKEIKRVLICHLA